MYANVCAVCDNTAKLYMRVTRRKWCEVRPRRIQHGGGESASGQSLRVLNEPELIYCKCFFYSRCVPQLSFKSELLELTFWF